MRFLTSVTLIIAACIASGCASKTPTDPYKAEQAKVLNNKGRLVQDLARPANVNAAKIEGATLVRGLAGTGCSRDGDKFERVGHVGGFEYVHLALPAYEPVI